MNSRRISTLVALTALQVGGCSAARVEEEIGDAGVAVYGSPKAAELWKQEKESTEAGSQVDALGLTKQQNVPRWDPPTLPQSSAAVLMEPFAGPVPAAVVLEAPFDGYLTVVLFVRRCSADDLASPHCWARWGATPWREEIGSGAALATP